jgi:hypothetical protein
VQPAGRLTISTPTGGVYPTVIGPAAFDGPALEMVSVAVPDVPGASNAFVIATLTSADAARLVTAVDPVLLAATGSGPIEITETDPPGKVVNGAAAAGMATGTDTVAILPFARGPANEHEIGPAGIVPVQPLGRLTMSAPTGGA